MARNLTKTGLFFIHCQPPQPTFLLGRIYAMGAFSFQLRDCQILMSSFMKFIHQQTLLG